MSGFGPLAERLRAIGEEIDEIAFDQLREAVADGEVERPQSDKRLMQARRAVEKAARLLDEADEAGGADEYDRAI